MDSEQDFVWTLIQSFSLSKKFKFEDKPFGENHPIKMDRLKIDSTGYRLSLSHMKYLAKRSSHLRVTCNFHAEGLQRLDYARTNLRSHIFISTFDKNANGMNTLTSGELSATTVLH